MILLLAVVYLFIGLSIWGITNELEDIIDDDYCIGTFTWYLFCWPIIFIVKIPDLYRKIADIFIDKTS